jgi:hypothetical protein
MTRKGKALHAIQRAAWYLIQDRKLDSTQNVMQAVKRMSEHPDYESLLIFAVAAADITGIEASWVKIVRQRLKKVHEL